MNRAFLHVVVVYFALVMPLVWFTDLTVNARDDLALYRLALYTPIVASSLLMALFAVIAAIREHQQRRRRVLQWPPEWDVTVAVWASTKATFFTVLWFAGAGWHLPQWVLITALSTFGVGHIFFSAQWLGPAGDRTHGRQTP